MDLGEVKKDGGDLDRGNERCLPGGPWGGTAAGSKSQRLEGHSQRPLLHLEVLASGRGVPVTSQGRFSLSSCCAMAGSVFLAEGSGTGTGWWHTWNGLSQTTDCTIGSLWDPKGEGCSQVEALRENPNSDLAAAGRRGSEVAPGKRTW